MPLTQIPTGMFEDNSVTSAKLSADLRNQTPAFKNRIINGAMGIWQRGTSSSTLGAYVADRWGVTAGTSVTASRSTDVPAGFQYSLSLAGTNFPQTYQRIESLNCVDLPGQTVTVSFWAKQTSGAAANSLAVSLATPNATDNYSTITTITTAATFTGSTSWTQYSATFVNLNSSVVNGLQVLIYANTASAATFLITGVQLEKGSTATSFDYRPYGTELALCQRYYVKTFPQATAPAQNAGNTGALEVVGQVTNTLITVNWMLPVEMRDAPSTVTTFSTNAASANWSTNTQTPTASLGVTGSKLIAVRAGTSLAAGSAYTINVTASAEL